MSTYNSADIAAFNGGVWVFCEQRQGHHDAYLLRADLRGAASWPTSWGPSCMVFCWATTLRGIAKELGGYGADGVYVCDHPPAGELHHRWLHQGDL